MKITFVRFAFTCLVAGLLASCSMLSAGSHVLCEPITIACSSDSVIQRLSRVKAKQNPRSFGDGLSGEQWVMHNFSFDIPEHQLLVRLEVPLHTPKNTEIHIAGIKDFAAGTGWIGFADVPAERKKVVLIWFNQVIRPALGCAPL